MRRRCRVGLSLACAVIAACGSREAAVPVAPVSAPAGTEREGHTVRAQIHPDLPEFSFTLIGDEATDSTPILHVHAIEIRNGGARTTQVLDALDTETPVSGEVQGLQVIDMNFDGYRDIRIQEFASAGPNTPYLNWLYDPATGLFEASTVLNEIASPEFDASAHEIRSAWRDGATRYGTDFYEVSNGVPRLTRRESRVYDQPGVYTLEISRWVDDKWEVVERRRVSE